MPSSIRKQLFKTIERGGGVTFEAIAKTIPAVVRRESSDSYDLILEAVSKCGLEMDQLSERGAAKLLYTVIDLSTTTKLEHRRVSAIALRLITFMSD